jgi:uncharacterized protein
MKNILIDAGPLIALFDREDNYHTSIISFIPHIKDRLITTWPVVAEVCHMLSFSVLCQLDFLTWCDRGGLKIEEIAETDIKSIVSLTKKYDNVPMDLADATLMILAKRLEIFEIISIDSDYDIYRTLKKEMVRNIFETSM